MPFHRGAQIRYLHLHVRRLICLGQHAAVQRSLQAERTRLLDSDDTASEEGALVTALGVAEAKLSHVAGRLAQAEQKLATDLGTNDMPNIRHKLHDLDDDLIDLAADVAALNV